MMLRRNADLSQVRPALAALLRRFAAENWIVFNPSFVVSPDGSEEREPADVAMLPVEAVCRFSGAELLLRIETDRIGFDWTDLAIESDAYSPDPVSDTCYLQCVDAATWYLLSDDAEILKVFEEFGFTASGRDGLPFPRLRLTPVRR